MVKGYVKKSNLIGNRQFLIFLYIFLCVVSLLLFLCTILLQNQIEIDYLTNCEEIKLSNDSFGLTSIDFKTLHSVPNSATTERFEGQIPFSSKLLKFHICENGYLQIESVDLSYGGSTISKNGSDLIYTACNDCSFDIQGSAMRIISVGDNSVADILISEEIPRILKPIQSIIRKLPLLILFLFITLIPAILEKFSKVNLLRSLFSLTIIIFYLYLAERLRVIFESGKIGTEKIIGNHQYFNKSQSYDILSILLVVLIIILIQTFKFKKTRG